MRAQNQTERNIFLAALTASSLTAITLWHYLTLTGEPISEWGSLTVYLFSFFTISTNLIVVIMGGALLLGNGRLHQFFSSAAVQSACCLYITFVGLGFWLLLGGPQGIESWFGWIPEICGHSLSPVLGAIFWFLYVPKGKLQGRHPVIWLSYPILYLVYWLIRGPLVGYYPYFFVDVNLLGYRGVAVWSGALIVIFLILGSLMLALDRWQGKRAIANQMITPA